MALSLSMMAVLLLILLHALRRDYMKGLGLAVSYLVFLPARLGIGIAGSLPQITFHRIVVVCLFLWWISSRRRRQPTKDLLYRPFWALLATFYLVSLFVSISPVLSFKSYLSFLIEELLFFVVVSRSIQSWEDIEQILSGIVRGLLGVALLAWIEKYSGVNVFGSILGYAREQSVDIEATYPHRILLGYAMAMGFPLCLSQTLLLDDPFKRRSAFVKALLLAAACYFSTSRGPWYGIVLGGLVLVLLERKRLRGTVLIIAMMCIAILILRPGVRETILNLVERTDEESLKGQSYRYRWELWSAAYTTVSVSTERSLFGYGGLSTESMDLSHLLQHGGSTKILGWTSIDNHYASDLIEFGFVGLILLFLFYAAIVKNLYCNWKSSEGAQRVLGGAILASVLVFMFAKSNVYIFSPQLRFCFWTLVALSTAMNASVSLESMNKPAEAATECAMA